MTLLLPYGWLLLTLLSMFFNRSRIMSCPKPDRHTTRTARLFFLTVKSWARKVKKTKKNTKDEAHRVFNSESHRWLLSPAARDKRFNNYFSSVPGEYRKINKTFKKCYCHWSSSVWFWFNCQPTAAVRSTIVKLLDEVGDRKIITAEWIRHSITWTIIRSDLIGSTGRPILVRNF